MVDEIVRNGGDVYIGYFPGKFSYVANAFKLSRTKCHKLRAASTYITLTHVEISEETTLIYLMTRWLAVYQDFQKSKADFITGGNFPMI